jgi:hypothetical protein
VFPDEHRLRACERILVLPPLESTRAELGVIISL